MIRLTPGTARAVKVSAGECVRVIDVDGSQVADLMAFRLDDFDERTSPSETLCMNYSFRLNIGDSIYSNRRQRMLTLRRDDSEGLIDLTNACCSPEFYAKHARQESHANCLDSLSGVLADYGLRRDLLPAPINIFQGTLPGPDGSFVNVPNTTAPGSVFELEAAMNLLVAVSCCPCDIPDAGGGSISGTGPSDIILEVNHG